jgi:hypothetical protein
MLHVHGEERYEGGNSLSTYWGSSQDKSTDWSYNLPGREYMYTVKNDRNQENTDHTKFGQDQQHLEIPIPI